MKFSYTITKFGARCDLSEELLSYVRKHLILTPIIPGQQQQQQQPPQEVVVYRKSKSYIYLPKFYVISKEHKNNFQLDLTITTAKERKGQSLDSTLIKFQGELKETQYNIIQEVTQVLDTEDACVLSAKCGMGKTVMSLYIISHLQKKTIILLDKTHLLHQWKDRINCFLPNAKIGIIQQDNYEIENCDIVLCMMQTILSRKRTQKKDNRYFPKAFDSFGFMIIDECHHICSQQFSQILFTIQTKKVLGLSATPQRKDGLTIILTWFMNRILSFEQKQKDIETPQVCLLTFIHNEPLQVKYKRANLYTVKRELNLPYLVTQLATMENRNRFLVAKILENYKQGRKQLILSDRRQQCLILQDYLSNENNENNENIKDDIGLYLGQMTREQLEQSNKKRIILATYQMCAEAYDCKTLDTLVFATPKSSIEQSVGRILRQKNTFTPLIIDCYDDFKTNETKQFEQIEQIEQIKDVSTYLRGQKYKRLRFYKQQNFKFI